MHKECGTSRGSKPVRIGDLCMGLISCLHHQPLTAFSEISAHVLEIADLSVDLTPTCDSHDQDWTGVTCWAIMCVQLSWRMTVMPIMFQSLGLNCDRHLQFCKQSSMGETCENPTA